MKQLRVGMVVPSLNTIAEDDFRRYCPGEVAYHVHRIRLRKEAGRVTTESLARAWLEAIEQSEYVADLLPDAVLFNCTGASVGYGDDCDALLAQRMEAQLGVPATNTMVAIKAALRAVSATRVLHVCPFTDTFSRIEHASLSRSGIDVANTVSLDFTDARVAARMTPDELASIVHARVNEQRSGAAAIGAVLLSCANVRAFEAVAPLEASLGVPVVTSNQAALWAVLALAGWRGSIRDAGRLFDVTLPAADAAQFSHSSQDRLLSCGS
ncbi:maleate cis-trans isomerase family protein [Chitinasiproducens palmae]|uniref:Maleate isomerase n=1 Tax=Chitinasiproducens palmae TaxID=1770053 RepID=A0A1H2PTY9_9BURK|nr:hypothetical protein [Chitinasiproducens palmae]SDV50608.1 maleate isomerase [Chitinasiproducens palmae]